MTGPKEEWLIWNMHFKLGFSSLDERLKRVEATTLQLTEPGQQNDNLASSSTRLQQDSDDSVNKPRQLEPASDQITRLDKQVQDLTASSRQSKEENKILSDRILQLEQQGTRREQDSELVRQLEGNLKGLEEDFKSVIATINRMEEINEAERGQRGKEMQQLRSQVGALIGTGHISGGRSRDAREMFDTITGDEDMLVDEQPKQQQSDAIHQNTEGHGVLIKAQASGTPLEDHLRYAENLFRRHETEAVRAFVSSLREKYRIRLGNKLEEYGDWTWLAAREESVRILEAEHKTIRRSARLMGGSVQPL